MGLNPVTGVLQRRGNWDTDSCTEVKPCEDTGDNNNLQARSEAWDGSFLRGPQEKRTVTKL